MKVKQLEWQDNLEAIFDDVISRTVFGEISLCFRIHYINDDTIIKHNKTDKYLLSITDSRFSRPEYIPFSNIENAKNYAYNHFCKILKCYQEFILSNIEED